MQIGLLILRILLVILFLWLSFSQGYTFFISHKRESIINCIIWLVPVPILLIVEDLQLTVILLSAFFVLSLIGGVLSFVVTFPIILLIRKSNLSHGFSGFINGLSEGLTTIVLTLILSRILKIEIITWVYILLILSSVLNGLQRIFSRDDLNYEKAFLAGDIIGLFLGISIMSLIFGQAL